MTTLANGIRNVQTTSSKHADRDVLALNEQNEARRDNEEENLMTRKTQGDLLHKLRQLRQWQQVQQENLLRDKERKLNFIREHEKRLQAVQEYQKKVLTQDRNLRNSPSIAVTTPQDQSGSKPLFHMQTHQQGFQEIPAGRQTYELEPEDLNSNVGNVVPVSRLGSAVLIPPQRTVLLSPQHFESVVSPLENTAHNKNSSQILSAGKPHNSLLLTQKIHLPTSSDEELSQLTESDGGSVSDIDGIRPIEETASETTAENDSDSDGEQNEDGDQIDDDDRDDDDDDRDDDDDDDNDDDDRDDDDDNENDDNDNEDNYEGHDTLNTGHYEPEEENSDEDNTLIDDDNEDVKQTYTSNEDLGINSKPLFDDIPIKPGLGTQAKTFEELLDEQLQAELKNEPKQQSSRPVTAKRTFLRKGEGLARFGLKTKKSIKEQNSRNREKTAQNSQSSTNEQKPIVTRKTATCKQSSTAQESSDQQPVFDQVVSRNRQLSSYVIVPYHSIDVAMDAHVKHRPGGKGDVDNVALRKNPVSAPVIEDSFQERMQKWDEMDIVEKEELNEFELLEEAAANCSLSSNSSTVLRILGKKKLQSVVDKNNNLPETVRETRFLGKGEDEDGDVVLDNGANNTLTEDKSDDDDDEDEDDTLKAPVDIISVHSSLALSHGFDDTKTWEDHGVLDSSDVIDDVILSLNTSTPVEKSRVQNPRATPSPHVSSAPPTSTLVTKFFPQLKAKAKEQTKNARLDQHVKPQQSPNASTVQPSRLSPSAPGGSISSNGAVEKVMSSAVREKLQELEKEIEKFREENAALHQLREAREKDLQELQREKTSFETYKTEELERLERFKAEEERRLRRDKRVFEQYQKASRALPDKKEREEITSLKAKEPIGPQNRPADASAILADLHTVKTKCLGTRLLSAVNLVDSLVRPLIHNRRSVGPIPAGGPMLRYSQRSRLRC